MAYVLGHGVGDAMPMPSPLTEWSPKPTAA